jgi:Zn ribbon nucleic-acid-binding protein
VKRRFLVLAACGFCRRETTFRLMSERDQLRRAVMVCTDCGRRQPQPGEEERVADQG